MASADIVSLLSEFDSIAASRDSDDALHRCGDTLAKHLFAVGGAEALLSSWLSAMKIDRAALPFDRGRSQIHNNGFAKVSLARRPGSWHLRLHIWPSHSCDARIHDHRWSFYSLVLGGRLAATNYRVSGEGGQLLPRYRLHDATGGGEKRLERDGSVTLRAIAHYEILTGGVHGLDYDEPHIVRNVSDETAVTLMLSAPAQREYSHSYGERSDDAYVPAPSAVEDARAIAFVEAATAIIAKRPT